MQKSSEEVNFKISNKADTLLLVVLTPVYATFSRSFAHKNESFDTIGIATFVLFYMSENPCDIRV